MKLASVLAGSLLFALAACSSTNTPSASAAPASEDNGGVEGPGVGAGTAPDTNPDGVPYPTDKIGTLPRKGSNAGDRIANYKFLGYPNGDTSGGLKPISLAQFFDPTGTKIKLIHIQASGTWCSACQAETRAVTPLKADLEARKVVWLVSLAEGPTPGSPSTEKDLKGWIAEFKSSYTHWLDPANKNLGTFYDRTALPWNANIDATTMEILTSGTGGVADKEGVLSELDEALQMAETSTLRAPK